MRNKVVSCAPTAAGGTQRLKVSDPNQAAEPRGVPEHVDGGAPECWQFARVEGPYCAGWQKPAGAERRLSRTPRSLCKPHAHSTGPPEVPRDSWGGRWREPRLTRARATSTPPPHKKKHRNEKAGRHAKRHSCKPPADARVEPPLHSLSDTAAERRAAASAAADTADCRQNAAARGGTVAAGGAGCGSGTGRRRGRGSCTTAGA